MTLLAGQPRVHDGPSAVHAIGEERNDEDGRDDQRESQEHAVVPSLEAQNLRILQHALVAVRMFVALQRHNHDGRDTDEERLKHLPRRVECAFPVPGLEARLFSERTHQRSHHLRAEEDHDDVEDQENGQHAAKGVLSNGGVAQEALVGDAAGTDGEAHATEDASDADWPRNVQVLEHRQELGDRQDLAGKRASRRCDCHVGSRGRISEIVRATDCAG
mmetsp:Transcript_170567/g.541848  ORF Transcript_170567/g.541848 Transcript_170567/m.541848 type:complete len:218 (-) Transcript_170567:431-1084(-)